MSALEPLSTVDPLSTAEPGDTSGIFIKRDDLSSPLYGGNKVRTLEVLFAKALHAGASEIWATGAYGSNHALATALHARQVGLRPGAIVFPQPVSRTAGDNLRALLAHAHTTVDLPHWSWLPWGMLRGRLYAKRRGVAAAIMVPGGATAWGALGYVSAALELVAQLRQQGLEETRRVVVAVGSTCTTAGLLLGLGVAKRLGLLHRVPVLHAVRVTPWPVTSPWRILRLSLQTAALLKTLGVPERQLPQLTELRRGLEVNPAFLGRGYGVPLAEGEVARRGLGAWGQRALDTTYAEKSAAGLWSQAGRGRPLIYWATKSSAPLPSMDTTETASRRQLQFLARCAEAPR